MARLLRSFAKAIKALIALAMLSGIAVLVLAFGYWYGSIAWDGAVTCYWKEVECVIIDSRVVEEQPEDGGIKRHAFRVEFRYSFKGQEHTSEIYSRRPMGWQSRQDAEKLVADYPPGKTAMCHVDPGRPTRAVLTRTPPLSALALALSPFVILAAAPVIVVLSVLLLCAGSVLGRSSVRVEKLLSLCWDGYGTLLKLSVFGWFLICGIAVAAGGTVGIFRAARTHLWSEAQCVIEEGSVGATAAKQTDEKPYAFVVRYRYSYDGEERQSDVYCRTYEGSFDYAEAQRLVIAYEPDSEAVCYVNPKDPSEAVLKGDSFLLPMFGLFLSIPFCAVGTWGVGRIVRGRPVFTQAPSDRSTRYTTTGLCVGIAFISLLLTFGIWASSVTIVVPLSRAIRSRGWTETRAVIVSSEVG